MHKRGIEEEAAKEISEDFVEGKDELFALMLENLSRACSDLGKEEILEYLSTEALHRQNVHLDSYDQLVHMVSKIRQTAVDGKTLRRLSAIARENAFLMQSLGKERAIV